MPELRSYLKKDVPRDIAIQIASYVRIQWPFLLGRKTPLWETAPYPEHGAHFVVVHGDVLISHALVVKRVVEHAGESFNVYGLASVFTYPTHRGAGYGEQVVAAATDHIRAGDADLAMLFCGERVKSLYLRCGWEHADHAQILYGEKSNPMPKTDNLVMMLFVSQKGRQAKDSFLTQPVYVGTTTW